MSWSDPCGVCGNHRADCECKTWNNVDGKYDRKNLTKQLTQKRKEAICKKEGHKWGACITVACTICGLDCGY